MQCFIFILHIFYGKFTKKKMLTNNKLLSLVKSKPKKKKKARRNETASGCRFTCGNIGSFFFALNTPPLLYYIAHTRKLYRAIEHTKTAI